MASSSCCCSSSTSTTETSFDKRDVFTDEEADEEVIDTPPSVQEEATASTYDYSSQDWFSWYEQHNTEVIYVDANVLYEYGEYYANRTVCTAIVVSDTSSNALKANVDNDDDIYFFSICANFVDQNEISPISEGETVVIVGRVEESDSSSLLSTDTINLYQSHVICTGEEAEEYLQELISQRDEQIEFALSLQAEAEQAAEEQAQNERDAYISGCQQVNYNDVARNPDNYDGTHIYISGSVIQVSEGWFDSVTLRVSSGGNVWLVDYWRDEGESRVLEGDYVTVYGECTGVTTYLTTDLSSATVPSIDAEIIDIN